MEQLRGRNLAHIGCTLGLVVGLTLGLFGAILALRISPSFAFAFGVFAALTVALGAAGYLLGGGLTRRLWGPGQPPR